jgi:hypothetical protein
VQLFFQVATKQGSAEKKRDRMALFSKTRGGRQGIGHFDAKNGSLTIARARSRTTFAALKK